MDALHIMVYLKQKNNSRLFLDPTYPVINKTTFNYGADWKEFYVDASEEIYPGVIEPRVKEVDILMMIDSDHAGDKATRCSRNGFLIYVNMAFITWLYKKQPTIESSILGMSWWK